MQVQGVPGFALKGSILRLVLLCLAHMVPIFFLPGATHLSWNAARECAADGVGREERDGGYTECLTRETVFSKESKEVRV